MIRRRIPILAIFCGSLGLSLPLIARADEKPPADPVPVENSHTLQNLSKDSQALYKKVAGSLVRVKVEGLFGPQLGKELSPQLRKEFEEWRAKQSPGPGQTGAPGPRHDHGQRGHGDPDFNATTMPTRNGGPGGGFGQGQLRRFLEQKLHNTTDNETRGRLNGLMTRLEAAPAGTFEITGVMIDDQGNTLIAFGPMRENAGATFHVTGPDGNEVTAKYVGAHLGRGILIIKLESEGTLTPLAIAQKHPEGGELLMCMTARQGAVGWITAPAASPAATASTTATINGIPADSPAANKKNSDDRFPIMGGDDHGTSYLFNANGELAAIGTDKFAIPASDLNDDIQWIIKNGKDIAPRALGVKYDPVLPELRKNTPGLGDKAAVLVKEVQPGSPADKAGLKKDDILLTIDDISIGLYFPLIRNDLATRTGNVPIGIIRNGAEKTLQMPFGDK